MLAAVLAMALLCACSVHQPQNSGVEESKKGEELSRPGEDNSEGAEGTSKEALSLSTPGGAVLIGTIDRDEQGWYFRPEQPLNVELTYFEERPLYFENLTRISMFENDVDGFEKSRYIGETVTAEGEVKIYRDNTEELYLLPYRIMIGRTADQSYAAPDLEYTSEPENQYDPSVPLPEQMSLQVENGHYAFNPYRLSQEALEYMGNGFADFYVDFVDAFLNYRTQCPCPQKEYAEMLPSIIYYEFPLFAADGQYEFREDYDAASGMITLHYTKKEGEHRQLVAEFLQKANALLEKTAPEQSEKMKAELLYHALCTSVTYDYTAMETRENIDAYYAYTAGTGICVTFANAYAQLLTQVGMQGLVVSGETSDGDGHAWNLIRVDGQNYFCDPTFELSFNNGRAFAYFGMTLADRTEDGTGKNGMSIGRYFIHSESDTEIAEKTLSIAVID